MIPGQARPRLRVTLDGAALPTAVGATLAGAAVRQVLGAPAVAELEFQEPPATLPTGPGAALRLDVEGAGPLFIGAITAVTHAYDAGHGRVLRLRAHDPLHLARTRRRVRTVTAGSAAILAQDLANELGLSCAVRRDAPERTPILQAGESDLELLVRLGTACGLYPVVVGTELRLVGLDGADDARTLVLGRELLDVAVTVSSERALGQAEVRGWDPLTSRQHREVASVARQDVQELRDSARPIGSEATHAFLARLGQSAAEAQALAQAAMDLAAATEAVATGTAVGDPALCPGNAIRLDGVAAQAAGRFVLTEVVHEFSAGGSYLSRFSTAPPEQPSTVASFLPARVSDIADPEELGRCRVRFDALGEAQSGWMQVVVPGAGRAKGLAALPEPDDTVLVLLPDGDAARGVVLGGLYGEQRLPRGLGAVRKRPFVLRTAGGQGLELGKEDAVARLTTRVGSALELLPTRVRLAAAGDMVIEAPGRTITLRANAIRLERG